MARDQRLSLEQSKRLTRARVLGAGRDITITLEDGELARLIAVIASDTGRTNAIKGLPALPYELSGEYYKIPIAWFAEATNVPDFTDLYIRCVRALPDFETYFDCICELHKRRRKYELILSGQPMPTMVQVSPRSLLEYGHVHTRALASWLTWRKWFFDIDNRAAQETGYLFEPILASALGGEPYPAKKSPIRRADDPTKGRQVDCIVGKNAYEFKLRVTIAASGQGRFGEELEFARDCRKSGFTPILLVLDPTPSARLADLQKEYERYGGKAYIGNEAWAHLESEAGDTMATFVERYVRRPIAEVDRYAPELLDFMASASPDKRTILFKLGGAGGYEWTIHRADNPDLAPKDNGEGGNEAE
jgi:hypothetical protein